MINREIMPHVVFVTAYDQYTLKAFEEKTLDYLQKPIDSERLNNTLAKLQETLYANERPDFAAELVARIPCLIGNRIKLVHTDEMEYLEAGPAGVHVST
jgi:two-component system LytT family response regulator